MNMSNLSAGVQILVTQLKENPDAFFGPIAFDSRSPFIKPKFSGWRIAIEEEILGVASEEVRVKRGPTTWFMTDEEKAALADAYRQAKRERFDANIIYTLNRPPEDEVEKYRTTTGQYQHQLATAMNVTKEAMRIDASGHIGIGTNAASSILSSGHFGQGGTR
jgi:DNA-binding transcriptional regulator YiaG